MLVLKLTQTILALMVFASIASAILINFSHSSYLEEGGVNRHQGDINIRKMPSMSASIIGKLKPKEFTPTAIQQPTSNWIHIKPAEKEGFVHKNVFTLGYSRLFGNWVITTDLLNQIKSIFNMAFIPTLILQLIILLIVIRLEDNRRIRDLSFEPDTNQKKQEIVENFILDTREEIITIENNKGDIEVLEEAVRNLQEKYDKAKEDALVFEIDLEDSKIDNLVKGRQFELFSAKIWHRDRRTTIEDWTPDKGIQEGIYIRSNGNPDFTISIRENGVMKIVAVECKYRSRLYYNKEKRIFHLNLDESRKIDRYKKYQDSNDIDVYLLMGVSGKASYPEIIYLLSINDAIAIKHNYLHDEKEYYAVEKSMLREFKISKHELIDQLNQ